MLNISTQIFFQKLKNKERPSSKMRLNKQKPKQKYFDFQSKLNLDLSLFINIKRMLKLPYIMLLNR